MTDDISTIIQLSVVITFTAYFLFAVLQVYGLFDNVVNSTNRRVKDVVDAYGAYTVERAVVASDDDNITTSQLCKTLMETEGIVQSISLVWFERDSSTGVDVFKVGMNTSNDSPFVNSTLWSGKTVYDIEKVLLKDFPISTWSISFIKDDEGFYHLMCYQKYYQGLEHTGTIGEFKTESNFISYPMVYPVNMFRGEGVI